MMTNLALLTTRNNPFVGNFLMLSLRAGIDFGCIIFDSKALSEKALGIVRERLNDSYKLKDINLFRELMLYKEFESHNSKDTVQYLIELGISHLINLGSPRILSVDILTSFQGVIGIHPGLIPRFRGCTNVEWAIFEDEQIGNSVFFLTEEVDRGPIILQEPLIFSRSDTYKDIRTKVYTSGLKLLVEGVKKVINQNISTKSLSMPANGSYYEVIDKQKLKAVMRKVTGGTYKYQV